MIIFAVQSQNVFASSFASGVFFSGLKMACGSYPYVHQGTSEFHWISEFLEQIQSFLGQTFFYNMCLSVTLLPQAEHTAGQASEGP